MPRPSFRPSFSAMVLFIMVGGLFLSSCTKTAKNDMSTSPISRTAIDKAVASLRASAGDAHSERITRGVSQVAQLWKTEDGDDEAFVHFCTTHFVKDSAELDLVFSRFESHLTNIYGYLTEMGRDLSRPLQLDLGPVHPVDELFGTYNLGSHVVDDLFATKLAFVVLLNFPQSTLEQRLKDGPSWTRRQWAEARLGGSFTTRIPAPVTQAITTAYTEADTYISAYNIPMYHLLTEDGRRLFPEGLTLISHWGLRDELKAQYDAPNGLERQRMIQMVMERIIRQEIPACVVNNPETDWRPMSNAVAKAPGGKKDVTSTPEPDTRYAKWRAIFLAEKAADPFHAVDKTFIDRKFNREREIPEKDVERLLTSILSSPLIVEVGKDIATRLGRPLEPFDIWYTGYRVKAGVAEEKLDALVSTRYPTVASFEKDLPTILRKVGFPADKAAFLASSIAVDPSRGAGHAMAGGRVSDQAHLRTRVAPGGMNYKGFNIAMHELGHCVEQTISLKMMDHTLLRGVPNTAFTEAFAFLFQSKDLGVLGVKSSSSSSDGRQALDVLWSTYEIAGVALVDMSAWRWLYEHPNASAAEFKQAVLDIARQVWNRYYAPVFGKKDVILLAVYSHLVDAGLYLPDYPMGHIIAFQIEEYLKDKNLATEMERMCRIGSVSPDLWMKTAVGAPISTEPLLNAAREALRGK